jgi:hypothetical protein
LADPGTYGNREKFAQVELLYAQAQKKSQELQLKSENAFEKLMELEEALLQ